MKFMNLCAAAMLAALAACGGGGGGDSPITPPVGPVPVTPPVTSVVCPDNTSAPTAAQCPAVKADVSALQGTTQDPALFNQGVVFQFNGLLDAKLTTTTWKQGMADMGRSVTTTSANGVTTMTVVPEIRLGYGSTETITIAGVDSVGRALPPLTLTFNTIAMSCTSNSKWSNPATFSTAFQNCSAPIGVQALYDPVMNTTQNNACTFTAGAAVTSECMSIMANGTLVLNDTSIIVENHPVVWVGYNAGSPGNLKGTIALVDRTTMKVVGVAPLTGQIIWTTGNPTGEAASFQLVVSGTARTSTFQVRWDGAAITTTCAANCS